MIQLNGKFAGLGSNNTFMTLPPGDVDKLPWLDEIIKLNGAKFITVPHKDSTASYARNVISLDRAFADEYGRKPDSIIEVQQDYKVFTDIVAQALNTPDVKKVITQKVYIYSQDGELIFPLENPPDVDNGAIQTYWNEIGRNREGMHTFAVGNAAGGSRMILAYTGSGFSGWTVAVAESESVMLAPVLAFRNRTMLASAGILLISLVLSYFVARGLTIPIKKIHRNIKSLRLETITGKEVAQAGGGINEFEDLNRSFSEMCTRLKSSLEEAVSARSHEIQAQMLALQSQMNPHFLYNTITVISIMAESEGNENVVKACMELSNMLRYISSGSEGCVTVGQELEHTENYLNLMKNRYQNKLDFHLDISECMLAIPVPKLVVQPLVENCTKYAINMDPPWRIDICGRIHMGVWEITVHDNGQGFDWKWLEETGEKLKTITSSEALPGLKLDGMGLKNIYLRLKLMYGDKAVFRLENKPGGGAAVTIGGPISNEPEVGQ
jgi:two-component system, sensor histidine kinase YesM